LCCLKIPKYRHCERVGIPKFQYFSQNIFGAQAPVVNIFIITIYFTPIKEAT